MNFPDTQRTGRLAELKVEELFTSWSWTVGKDVIDTGYDFMVEPDTVTFRGHRFLVQVKGTALSKKGSIVAPVAKKRLRQYANNPLPVFLVRSTANGVLYWLHIQPWAKQNMRRLSGDGDAGIKMLADQTLDDMATFSDYLVDVFKPAEQSPRALGELAQARSAFLSGIDPHFGVHVGVLDGQQSYRIYAKTSQARLNFDMTVAGDASNETSLRDTITYGLPASIDVEAFRLTGSPLCSVLGVDDFSKGRVDLRQKTTRPCTLILYPGRAYSLITNRFSLNANLYVGQGGFAIRAEDLTEMAAFELRGGFSPATLGRAEITMGLRPELLAGTPIQRLDALASLGDWAEQVIEQGGIYAEVNTPDGRIPMSAPLKEANNILPLLRYLHFLGVVHKVARALNSDITVDGDAVLEEGEASNLLFAYALLRGDRRLATLTQVDFNTTGPIQIAADDKLRVTTAIRLTVAGKFLGAIPVAIDLDGFTHSVVGENIYRLTKDDNGTAVCCYDEHGVADAQVSVTMSHSLTYAK